MHTRSYAITFCCEFIVGEEDSGIAVGLGIDYDTRPMCFSRINKFAIDI